MTTVLAFACLLLLAVLVSDLANRSVLSTAVLFLGAGVLLGTGGLGVISIAPTDHSVELLAELALFSVLFTDGMKVSVQDLREAWRLPGRALAFGLPLTLAATAVFAHYLTGLPWAESFLIGAALCPTDPVFASAIVGRREIPHRLRHLLNVESGLNDGLALPIVIVLLAVVGPEDVAPVRLAGDLVLGVAVGVAIPWAAIALERSRFFSAAGIYQPLNAVAIGLLVFAVTSLTHANEFLAAFAAGITVASLSDEVRETFHEFGELVAELLKLAALLVFGALITPQLLGEIPAGGYLFAAAAIFLARPLALGVALAGTRLGLQEWGAAAWFGPKGFASVVYGLLILQSGVPYSQQMFVLVALVVTASIVLHSSTDVVVAKRFKVDEALLTPE